ncbi:CD209 antigen-like protein C [Carassius gibelio]|uniref:CD209 antigen-like protein C n=1 Tax=Carassius gibelio TaxID=101364 RepID=UPI0022781444|nr:CD209 antigen-like protein C [Carassius gibelio]XP_052413639.1 CD209 antigen-like protein C [Carassius gibelio]
MSANKEGMHTNLIDGPDDDCSSPEVRYSVLQNPDKSRKQFCQDPFKVATACLTGFCLILLMILVVTSVHSGKARSDQDSLSSTAASHMQKGCANVSALTEELQAVKKEKSELEKERTQLKNRIAVLEATPAPRTTPLPTKSPCPEDWKHFNGSCYYVSEYRRSWSDSQTNCKRQGGHLAIILTAEEQTFIWNLLPRGYWNAFWFGISDARVEDDWYWVDGTKLVGGFWEDGEPNNHINEDCGYMIKTDVLSRVAIKSWYDAPCHMSLPWICEKPVSS